MGSAYEFDCKACGYRATVSGGRDCGFVAVVQTMTCHKCKDLVDVLIGRAAVEGPTGEAEYDADLMRCPKCNGEEVTPWDSSTKTCPRCDGEMSGGSLEILWD